MTKLRRIWSFVPWSRPANPSSAHRSTPRGLERNESGPAYNKAVALLGPDFAAEPLLAL
jgi:hypothetical protein